MIDQKPMTWAKKPDAQHPNILRASTGHWLRKEPVESHDRPVYFVYSAWRGTARVTPVLYVSADLAKQACENDFKND